MKKLKALKNRKGFTLVEIIVVLVILAVLAAAAIPTMLGFVEDSKGKALIAEARAGYVAAQSIYTETYAANNVAPGTVTKGVFANSDTTITNGEGLTKRFEQMLSPDITYTNFTSITFGTNGVAKVVYEKTVGTKTYIITLESGKAAVVTAKNS